MLKLYNTLTRSLEEFRSITDKKVLFYHCGPTVYWTQHIGNLRGMTMGDILVRTLRYFGDEVVHVRNYTDVGHLTSDEDAGEDKMDKGARREGKTPQEIAQKYITRFERDTKSLGLLEPTYKPQPSRLIPEIIAMIQILFDKGYAYTTDFAVYFDVSKFVSYTVLSRQNMEKNIRGAGSGDAEDSGKRHSSDFALWVFRAGAHKNALQTWDSPFLSALVPSGNGFPGWHIECSVMAKKYLGDTIDIHMGGVEHIPIHHTNEIAQSVAANGVPFVRYWLHNEHLLVDGKKMAKSEGTGFSLDDVAERGFDPLAMRYFFLQAHYRSQQNFTWDALAASQRALSELRTRVLSFRDWGKTEQPARATAQSAAREQYEGAFMRALESDLNTPQALAILWDMTKSDLPSLDKYHQILHFDEVLGLQLKNSVRNQTGMIPEKIMKLAQKRELLRTQKKFQDADALRVQIEDAGYSLEDTDAGPRILQD